MKSKTLLMMSFLLPLSLAQAVTVVNTPNIVLPGKTVDQVKGAAANAKAKAETTTQTTTETVKVKTEAVKTAATKASTVNVNTASIDELSKLPGIGAVKAKAIVAGRPYKEANDLQKVKGIKAATIAKLKDKITF